VAIVVAAAILGLVKYGEKREKLKVAESNLEAAKRVKETSEAIINRKRGDGISKLRKLQKRNK
jgi:hypothetical protein